jgi:hypothetical protein
MQQLCCYCSNSSDQTMYAVYKLKQFIKFSGMEVNEFKTRVIFLGNDKKKILI